MLITVRLFSFADVEYSRTGEVIKGRERAKARSKYEEDGSLLLLSFVASRLRLADLSSSSFFPSVYPQNHTSVWGSFYILSSGTWGYACCHATLHGSYCTGETGRQVSRDSSVRSLLANSSTFTTPGTPASPPPSQASGSGSKAQGEMAPPSEVRNFSKKRHGEGEVVLDKERLERALAEERKRKNEEEESQVGGWSQKKARGSKYNNTSDSKAGDGEVTEEQLGESSVLFLRSSRELLERSADLPLPLNLCACAVEAYRLTRSHDGDDPMSKLTGDEILPL